MHLLVEDLNDGYFATRAWAARILGRQGPRIRSIKPSWSESQPSKLARGPEGEYHVKWHPGIIWVSPRRDSGRLRFRQPLPTSALGEVAERPKAPVC